MLGSIPQLSRIIPTTAHTAALAAPRRPCMHYQCMCAQQTLQCRMQVRRHTPRKEQHICMRCQLVITTGRSPENRPQGGVEPLTLSGPTDLKSAPRTVWDHAGNGGGHATPPTPAAPTRLDATCKGPTTDLPHIRQGMHTYLAASPYQRFAGDGLGRRTPPTRRHLRTSRTQCKPGHDS